MSKALRIHKLNRESTCKEYELWLKSIEEFIKEKGLWNEEKTEPVSCKSGPEEFKLISSSLDFDFFMELGADLFSDVRHFFKRKSIAEENRFEEEGILAKKEFYSIEKGDLSIRAFAKRYEELENKMKICSIRAINEKEKITVFLLSLPNEYAVAVLEIKNSNYSHFHEILPTLYAAELEIEARNKSFG